MADVNITVSFKPTLEALREKFGSVNIQSAVRDEINKILFRVESYGKQLAPVGTPESTHVRNYHGGALRANIQTSPLDIGGEIGGMVSTNTDYAIYVHEGTYKMRPRPFLETAAKLVQPNIDGQISVRLDEEFTRAFKTL